jgi:hypothetical protein
MNVKVVVVAVMLLAASGALASGPMAKTGPAGTVITNQVPGFGDDTTGPTNPRGQVQSPDWV